MDLPTRSLIVQCVVDQHRRVRKILSWHDRLPVSNRADVIEGWLSHLLADVGSDHAEHLLLTTSLPALMSGKEVDVQLEPLESGARISIYCDLSQGSFSSRSTDRLAAVFDSLYRSSLDALVTIDTHGNIVEFNQSAEAMFGYRRDEVHGTSVADVVIPHAMRDAHHAGMDNYLKTGEGPVINNRIEVEAIRRDGSLFPCELTVVPAEINGETAFFTAFIRDISERKANETALTRAKEAAEAASEAKSRFLAHMSHEIRTPASAVIGCLELLSEAGLEHEQRILVQTADDAGRNLLDIIEDILSFSKIESGTYQLHSQAFNPVRLLEQVVESAAVRNSSKDIHIGCCVAPDVPLSVVSDPVAIRQVVSNLVENAMKFTQQGGVSVRVYLQEGVTGADHVDLRIVVQDSGAGIDVSQQDKIFDEFGQVDSSDQTTAGGTGLGLAICKRLLDALGGHITVDSELGKGSRFQVLLPCDLTDTHETFMASGQRIPALVGVESCNAKFTEDVTEQLTLLGGKVCPAIEVAKATAVPLVVEVPANLKLNQVIAQWAERGVEAERLILGLQSAFSEEAIEARKAGVKGVIARPFTGSALIGALTAEGPGPDVNTAQGEPEDAALEGCRILLAEDSKANQLIASAMLQQEGCLVDVVENGSEAIAAVAQHHYAAVLMDLRMPVVDGLAATREIRKTHSKEQLPIIALTANVFGSDVDRCLDAGMNDFMGKPVNRRKLSSILSHWIYGASEQSEGADPHSETEVGDFIDRSLLEQLRQDTSDEAVEIILKAFEAELTGFVAQLQSFDGSATPTAAELGHLREYAHRCKSSAGYCGATHIQALAASLEKACSDNALDRVTELLPQLVVCAEKTQVAIDELQP